MKKFIVLICTFLIVGIRTQAQFIVQTTVTAVSCYGGSNGSATAAPLGGTSPYTYAWTPGSQTTSAITGLTAGTYTIQVTDHLGATASAPASVTQPAAISVSASAKYSAVCPGASDSLYANVTGGLVPYSYSWTAPFGDLSNTTSQNVNSYPYASTYVVTAVNDANGCSATASINVTIRPFPYVTISGSMNPIIPGHNDTLVANVIGSAGYLWSNLSTTSSIVVSPSVSTTYSVKVTNTYGCIDTAAYYIDTNSVGNGTGSGNAIRIVPGTGLTKQSFSTYDSVEWFSFVPTDSNNQIIAYSAYLGFPVPHGHRLTLFDNSLNTIVDEPMPDITGANQIRIDVSHLHMGSTYLVRASRCPAQANMPGCNPTGDVCNASQRWDFQIAFRTVPVFVPNDSASEPPAVNQLYYEDRGQIADMNDIPRFDIKAYTNIATPAVYASDSAISFVYGVQIPCQRVDMVLTGSIYSTHPNLYYKWSEDSGAGYMNYFKEFTVQWCSKIEGYSRLVYKNVYPNVDMQVYSNNEGTKLYFVCNPGFTGAGGNPADIELEFKGASSVTATAGGSLNVATDLGTLSFAPGFAYTDSAGIIKPKSWTAKFVTVNSNTVKFNTGTFNTSEPLVIEVDRGHNISSSYSSDGNLNWSTYYGGTNSGNIGTFQAVTHSSDSGNVYAVGYTTSAHFPTYTGAFDLQGSFGGDTDAIVVKFNKSYVRQWATYYGGSGAEIGRGITMDDVGGTEHVYFTGSTNSTDLKPERMLGCYSQTKLNGTGLGPNTDAFMAEIVTLGGIAWSTYYGGLGNESGHYLAEDINTANLYMVGVGDTNTPLAHNASAYNSTTGGGLIVRFRTLTNDTTWATLIGSNSTSLNGCAVDGSSNFYVTGGAFAGYPVESGYLYDANMDAVVTKFDHDGAMVWSTYYGGIYKDVGNAITTDGSGNVFVTGHSYSPTLPYGGTYSWSYYQDTNGNGLTPGGNGNAFIVEFAPVGYQLIEWSAFFGGKGDMDGAAITTDANNNVYITGDAECLDSTFIWPQTQPAGAYVQHNTPSGDIYETFIAAFNVYQGYYWGTYLDGTGSANSSVGYGITAYGENQLYVVGNTATPPYEFANPGGLSWFQDTIDHASSIAFISEFDIASLTTGINENKLNVKSGELKIYPNPAVQNVTVQMNLVQTENVEFTIYNLLGEPVYSETTNEPAGIISKQISLSFLSNGNYILQARTADKVYYAKITKLQ